MESCQVQGRPDLYGLGLRVAFDSRDVARLVGQAGELRGELLTVALGQVADVRGQHRQGLRLGDRVRPDGDGGLLYNRPPRLHRHRAQLRTTGTNTLYSVSLLTTET